jgi:hypothetical protein
MHASPTLLSRPSRRRAGAGFLVGAFAWGVHVAIDRAAGYGLRTRDGLRRG